MQNIKKKITAGFLTGILLVSVAVVQATHTFAASTAYVQIVGSSKILFSGDITPGGCTVTDESNVVHTYPSALAICALDAAAKQGGFTYKVIDYGGNLGLFIDAIGSDTTPSDFSKYWSYNYNGQQAQNGVSNQAVQAGDVLSFQYSDPGINIDQQSATWGINYLKTQQTTNGDIQGFSGVSAWSAMAFSTAGIDPGTVTNGGTSLLAYLKNNPPTDTAPATEIERDILALTAANQNPYNFGSVIYEAKLESFANNSQLGVSTQVNDDVFGLLALIASGQGASSSVKQDALNFIIKSEQSDGGFSWSTTGSSDVDDTAAAIQALVAAQNNGMTANGLSDAISKSKTFMLNNQKPDGSFVSSPTDTAGNTDSTAWAAMALHALGMDSSTQMTNALSYIRSNQQADGSFSWQNSSTGETFTTSYAIPALEEKSWPIGIYSGSAPVTPTPTETVTATPVPTETLTPTVTVSPSITPTGTVTPSPTETPIPTVSSSLTPTEELSPTITVTLSPSPTETPTPTPSPIPTATEIPTVTPMPDETATPTPAKSVSVTSKDNRSDRRNKIKEPKKLIKDTQKQIHSDLDKLKKHHNHNNRVIYQHIRDMIKNLGEKLRALFGK